METKQELEKAKEILAQMLEYINNKLKDYAHKKDFKPVDIMFLKNKKISMVRGHADLYFYIGHTWLNDNCCFVGGYCSDGYFIDKGISSDQQRHSYNEEDKDTIELTLAMIKHWEEIKRKIEVAIENYKNFKETKENLFDNFKI